MAFDGQDAVAAPRLIEAIVAILSAAGVSRADALIVAGDLVVAEQEGLASHGVMLVPMYVERLRAGSISTASLGIVVSDRQASVVLDAGNIFGQLSAHQAIGLAVDRARQFGLGAVSVRNAFHIGAAGRYARLMADAGCAGIVMANTRPLMPATGGAEALTGNNPIAIAVPSAGEFPPAVDMALSAAALGKIRNAAAAGKPIPPGWATDNAGVPTTDPNAAIAGMLLPAAGAKGFGLAFLIDLLCGGLSGGGIGAEVKLLHNNAAQPYNSASLFIAIDIGHFVEPETFMARTQHEAERVAASKRAPGIDRIYAPGERSSATRQAAGNMCKIAPAALAGLINAGHTLGVDIEAILGNTAANT